MSDIISPRDFASGIHVQWLGESRLHSEAAPCLSLSPPHQDAHTALLGTGNCLLQQQMVEPGEVSWILLIHLVFVTLCKAPENPIQILLITPITIHLAPPSLQHLDCYPGALASQLIHH